MTRTIREWSCEYASASEAGDYVQVLFEETVESDNRYVLIQSQFEFPQDYDVQVEADGGEWYAQLTVERAILDHKRFVLDGCDDAESVRIVVNFVANEVVYAELTRVLLIMLPDMEIN
jgi:hypothetical protein